MIVNLFESLGVNSQTFIQGGAVMWPLLLLSISLLYSCFTGIMSSRAQPTAHRSVINISQLWLRHQCEARLEWLKLLTFIAPLLGLLGTVTGMIEVFSIMASSGQFSPGMISSGISKAMITTQTGLILGLFGTLCVFNIRTQLRAMIGASQ